MTRMAIVIEFDTPEDPQAVSSAFFEATKKVFDDHNRFGVPVGGMHAYATMDELTNAVMAPIELHRVLVPPSGA